MSNMVWYKPSTWFKQEDARHNHSFSDEDRETSALLRRQKAEIKIKEMQLEAEIKRREQELRLQELEEQLGDFNDEEEEEGNSPEAMLMQMFAPLIASRLSPQQPTPAAPASLEVSREKLLQIYDELPNYVKKIAKKMSDEDIRTFIIGKVPNASKATIDEAIAIIRHE